MNDYFDTGIVLKLYTSEPGSAVVQAFVQARAQALPVTDLHQAECTSALRLKQFRGEASEHEVTQALRLWQHDLRMGVLRLIAVDWNAVWSECRKLADRHASSTGCRTLDTLHIASARVLGFQRIVTSDRRQADMATLAGLTAIDPLGTDFSDPSQHARLKEGLLISPVTGVSSVADWWDGCPADPDFMADGRQQPAMQDRDLRH